MKLNKNKIIALSTLMIGTIGVITPIGLLVSCGQSNVTYTINNSSSSQVTFNNLPSSIKKGTEINTAYTINGNKILDEEYTDILVDNTSIKNKTSVVFKNNILKIPASLITGNLTIKIIVASECTVSNISSSDITFTNLPSKILEGHKLDATYTISSGKTLNEQLSILKVGDNSIKESSGVEFKNNRLLIPANLVTNNITIGFVVTGSYLVNNTSTGVNIVDLPTTILEGNGIDTTYTINTGCELNESECDILVGTTSIKSEASVVFKNNVLQIPADKIVNNLTIHLQADLYRTLSFSATTGGTISSSASVKVKDQTTWGELEDAGKIPTATPSTDYTFSGWYTDGGIKLDSSSKIDADMTATAKFAEIDAPAITSAVENIKPPVYNYNSLTGSYEETSYQLIDKVMHFNNLPIGYISIANYFNSSQIGKAMYTYTTDENNKTVTIKNIKDDSTATIYFKKQKIVFSDYEKFIDWTYPTYGPLTGGCGGGRKYYTCTYGGVTNISYVNDNERTIDFKNYNIKLFFYNNEGFLPYEVYENILDIPSVFRRNEYCKNSSYDYNGSYFMQVIENLDVEIAKEAAKNKTTEAFKNSTYMQYSYDLFALTLDTRYGLVERKRRDTSNIEQKMPNGAYAMMSQYHDAYVKAENETSGQAFLNILKKLDDCGHTVFTCQNIFPNTNVQYYSEIYGDEYIAIGTRGNKIRAARTKALGNTIDAYKEYEDSTEEKIAYITFDSFTYDSNFITDEETSKGRELPSGTTSSNYSSDTFRLTMWANEQIRQNNVKNVVVDLSCNGGGVVCTEHFIASWLCGGVTEKIYNPKTNSYCEYTVKADINGDDVFDSYDYLASDVKLYMITTTSSFSCGNMLPTNVQDNRTTNTTFIGTGSGGGSCFVDSDLLIGANTTIRISSTNHMLRKASSYGNFITNDTGCTVDEGWAIDDSTEAGQNALFDRATLNNRIWGKV